MWLKKSVIGYRKEGRQFINQTRWFTPPSYSRPPKNP